MFKWLGGLVDSNEKEIARLRGRMGCINPDSRKRSFVPHTSDAVGRGPIDGDGGAP